MPRCCCGRFGGQQWGKGAVKDRARPCRPQPSDVHVGPWAGWSVVCVPCFRVRIRRAHSRGRREPAASA